ncbi:MAG: hypothetical protein K2W96_17255 [Gemmataceae bacterium]|nr:hypothetical protein [Gemmataceae bacterium]
MGGSGSGNHWNHDTARTTVEACLTIDANRWTREGILKAGARDSGSWRWTWTSGRSSTIGYEARTDDTASPCVRLCYTSKRDGKEIGSEDYFVGLTTTRPNYGGLRWWFVCPLVVRGVPCERRAAKLHLPPRARYFGCRQCHGLTYTSCQESPKDDALCRMLARSMGTDFLSAKQAMRELANRG